MNTIKHHGRILPFFYVFFFGSVRCEDQQVGRGPGEAAEAHRRLIGAWERWEFHGRKPSGYVKIAIENHHLEWIFPLKMVDLSIVFCMFTRGYHGVLNGFLFCAVHWGIIVPIYSYIYISGWWFGTWLLFSMIIIWDVILPID